MIAFAACEYSHWVRKVAQFAGTAVQLVVAWFVGNVQMKITTSEVIISKSAANANQNAGPSRRTKIESARLASMAPMRTNSNSAHPR